jgi:integrase
MRVSAEFEFRAWESNSVEGAIMPKKAKELTATEVRRLMKPGLHAVGGVAGLLLQVTATGARSWILRATVGAKRRDIGLGGFPDVPLAMARENAREAREKIRQGVDPVAERRAARDALRLAQARVMTFRDAALRTYEKKEAEFKKHRRRNNWIRSLEMYAFPIIGHLPVAEIDLPHVQKVLEPIWHDKTHTATKVRERMESVFAWAIVSGYRTGDNPARWKGNLREVLPKPSKITKTRHFPALPWNEVPAFMPELRKREGMSAKALEFIIYTAARSSEARLATWGEVDLEARLWTVPEERMKAGKPHRVPLCDDAVRLLKALPRFEGSDYVFTAPRGGPLSDMSISAVCRRMGVDAVPHGFRSSFKDWARSCTRYADEVSELALAHVNSDATRAAYARDELLPQRTRLMREWGKFLNTPTTNAAVVPMRAKK